MNEEEFNMSNIIGLLHRLKPLYTKLLKDKQSSHDSESMWAQSRVNFLKQFLIHCSLSSYDEPKLYLKLENLTPICIYHLSFWDEIHRKVTVSGTRIKKEQV